MVLDQTTLNDLEVLAARDGGRAVLDLLDHTRTRQGRLALRQRLKNPLSTIQEIRAVQDALPVLADTTSLNLPDDAILSAAERYIHSDVVFGGKNRLGAYWEGAWLRLSYPAIPRELAEGQASIRVLVRFSQQVIADLCEAGKPVLLRTIGDQLAALNADLERALRAKPLLIADQQVRAGLRNEVLEVIRLMGELDALRSMALASQSPGWTMPELVESSEFFLDAKAAFHPFVKDGTANPICLTGDNPVMFLTGPNMAGKTTYLKTVALVVLLAQMGMNVPAASVRLAPVEVVFTSLNPVDNLRAGISFFYAEILRVREAAQILAEGRRALVLFDEVFKGTNVKDALEASAQVIKGFAQTRRSGSVFASHLSELHESLRDDPAIRFCQFGGELRKGKPTFSYTLKSGVSDKRFGLLLLEQAQVPELMAKIGA
jgi:DNA mismatch repair ATPase MutS